jgi:DNA-binding NtrC family response regulator
MSIHYEETNRAETPALPVQEVGGFRTREEFARFLQHAETVNDRGQKPASLRAWLELAEAWRITQALRECKGNRSAAARLLGIGRRTLYAKMDKLGITPTWSF